MLPVILLCSLMLSTRGQHVEDGWIDPYDMLNYDTSTKTMRKSEETANYSTGREYNHKSGQAEQITCDTKVAELQKQVEQLQKIVTLLSQQPTCNPVESPSNSEVAIYDDHKAWKWDFEETFGMKLDTLLKMGGLVLVLINIIRIELWSTVSWFMQLYRILKVSSIVSIFRNWLYLYEIEFAKHQNNLLKANSETRSFDWLDALLLVPPLKITLPIPVLLTIVLTIVVFMYGSVNAVFRHGITAPFRNHRRDPPPPQLERQRHVQEIEDDDHLAGGDVPQQALRHRADDVRLYRNQVHQRRPNRPREERAKVVVETVCTAGPPHGGDETDAGMKTLQDQEGAEDKRPMTHMETVGIPVQESSPACCGIFSITKE